MELFKRLHDERGITVCIVTHDSGVARQTNRIVHIRDGKIDKDERL